jgi:uncharacterized protein involved in tellurium resistance
MGDTDFSTDRLLEQASGNQSAMFFVALRWARDRDGSVDGFANFVGEQFANSWGDMRDAGARDIARIAGVNFASSADSKFIGLEGDDQRAEALIEGPDAEWLVDAGVTLEDSDRANELIFARIAQQIGVRFESHRDANGLHLIFSRGSRS